jgi:hypothetical protein
MSRDLLVQVAYCDIDGTSATAPCLIQVLRVRMEPSYPALNSPTSIYNRRYNEFIQSFITTD